MKKKFLSIALVLALCLSMLPVTAMAAWVDTDGDTIWDGETMLPVNDSFDIEKVSNPQNDVNGIDGLEAGGDRLNSYAWSMRNLKDFYGDYVYVGSNRNILYNVLGGLGTSGDIVDALVSTFTNGEISTSTEDMDYACMVRYNNATGEMETYLDSANPEQMAALSAASDGYDIASIWGFRSSIEFKGVPYFNGSAYSADGQNLSLMMRITSNNQELPELVYCDAGGDLRASCVSADGNTLYVGGNDNAYNYMPDDGSVSSNAMQFIAMRTTDGKNFEMIADPTDFGQYCIDGSYRSTGGDAWDMAEYNGYVYFSMMTTVGGIVFRGYEDASHRDANEYGWVWEEFVGENGVFAPGFGNPLNYTVTPVVYDGDLYFITFTDAMGSMIYSVVGLFQTMTSGNMDNYFNALRLVDRSMQNETSVYRMLEDGTMQMVVGDESDLYGENIEYVAKIGAGFNDEDRSTTQYNWRATEFDGKLYIGTFDAYALYKYLTKLTNGDLFEMSQPEFQSQLAYLFTFLNLLQEKSGASVMMLSGEEEIPDIDEPAESVLTEEVLDQVKEMLADDVSLDEIYEAADLFSLVSGNSVMLFDSGAEEVASISDEAMKTLTTALSYVFANVFGEATTEIVSEMLRNVATSGPCLEELAETALYYADLLEGELAAEVFRKLADIVLGVKAVLDAVDPANIQLYMDVSDTIAANDHPGFELYCTEDGVNYEAITVDGFGSEFNYGVRNILATDDALFIGTANPYYGAQLWKLTPKVHEDPVSPFYPPFLIGFPADYDNCRRGAACPLADYSDLDPTAWYHDGIHYALQNGLMNGVGNGKFQPNASMSRAMLVTILWRLEGSPMGVEASGFADNNLSSWYGYAVEWAAAFGIVEGANGMFNPSAPVTREQFATILYRYARYKGYDVSIGEETNILSYNDAFDVSDYAYPALQWACGAGIMEGNNGNLMPLGHTTRAQAATMLMRFDAQ